MNAQRRRRIGLIEEVLDRMKAEIEDLAEEEQEAFDNLPESVQSAERGDQMQGAADNLQSAVDSVEEAIEMLRAAAD